MASAAETKLIVRYFGGLAATASKQGNHNIGATGARLFPAVIESSEPPLEDAVRVLFGSLRHSFSGAAAHQVEASSIQVPPRLAPEHTGIRFQEKRAAPLPMSPAHGIVLEAKGQLQFAGFATGSFSSALVSMQ